MRVEKLPREVAEAMAKGIERKMRDAAANLEFEKAAALRDELVNLRKQIGGNESMLSRAWRRPISSSTPCAS